VRSHVLTPASPDQSDRNERESTIWTEAVRYSLSAFIGQRSEGRPEYFVRHQFGSQQPLEHQPFGHGVQDTYQLVSWNGKLFLFSKRAKPLLAESVALGRDLSHLGAHLFVSKRICQAG
jgi:hypothetical protein